MPKELVFQNIVNKEYQKADIPEEELKGFCTAVKKLFENLDMKKDEEHNKKLLMDCFATSLFPHNAINSDSKTDFVIYSDETSKGSSPVVLVETKKCHSDEMITSSHLNKKALHQIILYYLQQERKQNIGIKHLVVTDFHDFFVFDKMNFLRLFASKTFTNKIESAESQGYKREKIYHELIARKVDEVYDQLEYFHVNLKQIYDIICKDWDKAQKNKNVIHAYKLLSPVHLLKQKYGYNHNKLNQAFYDELLFIMGLEEKKDSSNKNILKIIRKEKNRQFFSLIEQCIFKIKEKESLSDEEELYERALGLVIVWINRILFIKLLESQLKEYVGNDDFRILHPSLIKSYSDLNTLFFHILAHKVNERDRHLDKFKEVPYLNSSLFEESEVEQSTRLTIDNMMMGDMDVYEKTKVRTPEGKIQSGKANALNYLLDFLDSYDFGSYSKSEDTENLINAAVLGLIFEKINGYKDGAYFTPSYITEYMCRESIRMKVVELFNIDAQQNLYSDFEDLKQNLPRRSVEERLHANDIVNSIKICDPSVGSGHFLVSALNELIAIKSELRILQEHTKEMYPIEWDIKVVNDELDIRNGYNKPYQYDPASTINKKVQETLFEEKRILIENCLFGVDLNPKSVDICKLRLWIELLKNAYYINTEGESVLVTLPNIDTNVKCGNSLISHRPVRLGSSYSNNQNTIPLIQQYKEHIKNYKNTNNKVIKAKLSLAIKEIKKRLNNSQEQNLFVYSEHKESHQDKMYRNAFEWMIEFPDVMDDAGVFQGFDIIIGNPPYISLQTIKEDSKVYGKEIKNQHGEKKKIFEIYEAKGDIYSLFFERATHMLKKNGLLCFITSNKWMNTDYGKSTQSFIISHTNPIRLIDFPGLKLFDKATVETNILQCSLAEYEGKTLCVKIGKGNKDKLKSLWDYVHGNSIVCNFSGAEGWRIESDTDIEIMNRVHSIGKQIKDIDEISLNFGIKTGNNDAFLISEATRENILSDCLDEEERQRTEVLIQPILRGQDLICYNTPNHEKWLIALFPSRKYSIERFPAVKKHLLSFAKQELKERGYEWVAEEYLEEYCKLKLQQDHKNISINGILLKDKNGNTDKSRKKGSNKWFETQDNIAYWEEFSKPKIVWKRIGDKLRTTFDTTGAFGLDSTCIATGSHISFLCCLFNSKIGRYLFSKGQRTGTGDLLVSCQAVAPIFIPSNGIEDTKFDQWLNSQTSSFSDSVQKEIDEEIFRLYGFTKNTDQEIIDYISRIAEQYI